MYRTPLIRPHSSLKTRRVEPAYNFATCYSPRLRPGRCCVRWRSLKATSHPAGSFARLGVSRAIAIRMVQCIESDCHANASWAGTCHFSKALLLFAVFLRQRETQETNEVIPLRPRLVVVVAIVVVVVVEAVIRRLRQPFRYATLTTTTKTSFSRERL